MKRILSALLCAVLLLGLLPAFSQPARMKGPTGTVSTNRTTAYVGDTLTWTVSNLNGTGPYLYYFDVFRNGSVYRWDMSLGSDNVQNYKPPEPGSYNPSIWVFDAFPNYYIINGPATAVSLRPAAKITKVEAKGGDSLKISWEKIAGAGGYFLERSTSKTGGFKQVKATASTSFTDTSLKAGTRYYYRVRSYNVIDGVKWPSGKYSAPAAGVPLAKAAITGTSSVSASQVELTWEKVTGATGYQVFRSDSKSGTYNALRKISALSIILTDLEPGTTYYFKVRAYKNFGTSAYNGPMSGYRTGRTLSE